MLQDRDVAINARVSQQAALRLKQLSNRTGQSYGQLLDGLILAVPVESADWEGPMAAMQERLDQLEATVETMRAGWAGAAQNGARSDAAGRGIVGQPFDANVAEIALEAPLSGSMNGDSMEEKIEAQADHSSHPVQPKAPAKLTVKEFIAKQIEAGERSPSKIARALNEAGYLTNTRTPFERSNPQITKAIKAVGG